MPRKQDPHKPPIAPTDMDDDAGMLPLEGFTWQDSPPAIPIKDFKKAALRSIPHNYDPPVSIGTITSTPRIPNTPRKLEEDRLAIARAATKIPEGDLQKAEKKAPRSVTCIRTIQKSGMEDATAADIADLISALCGEQEKLAKTALKELAARADAYQCAAVSASNASLPGR